jgi:uncharacterized protein
MTKHTRLIIVIGTLCIGLLLFYIQYYKNHPLNTRVVIHSAITGQNHEFIVDLAVTPEEKFKGLGGRASMDKNKGMLFIFDHKEKFGFVMRDMQFPLDFVWIDGTTIKDITPNVPLDTTLPNKSYQPIVDVEKVLELNAGIVDQYHISIGDSIQIVQP